MRSWPGIVYWFCEENEEITWTSNSQMSETYSEISPSRRFNYRADGRVAKPNRAASKMQFPFLGMGHRSLIWDLTNKNGDLMGLPLITSCFGGSFCGSFYLGPSSPRISCCKHGSSEGKGWSKSFPSVKLWSCAKSDRPARLWSNRSPKVKVWSVLGHLHGYTPRSLETSSGTDKDWSKSQGTSNRTCPPPTFLSYFFQDVHLPKIHSPPWKCDLLHPVDLRPSRQLLEPLRQQHLRQVQRAAQRQGAQRGGQRARGERLMEAFAQGQAVQSRQAPESHNYFDVKKQQIGLEKRCIYIYIAWWTYEKNTRIPNKETKWKWSSPVKAIFQMRMP